MSWNLLAAVLLVLAVTLSAAWWASSLWIAAIGLALVAVLVWRRRRPLSPGIAVISGGSGGIGKAIARALVARDWHVVVLGRDQARLLMLAVEGMTPVRGDLASAAGCASCIAGIRQVAPRIDLLVHAAGTPLRWTLGTPVPDELDAEVALQVQAPIRLTEGLADLLAPDARIVAVTSCIALAPKQVAPGYSAAKAGLRQWIRAQRLRGPWPVVEVLPPLVDTAMTAGRAGTKMPPEKVALALLEGLERRRRCIAIGPAIVVRVLARLWPSLATRLVQERSPG